jgi:hypothetical protein
LSCFLVSCDPGFQRDGSAVIAGPAVPRQDGLHWHVSKLEKLPGGGHGPADLLDLISEVAADGTAASPAPVGVVVDCSNNLAFVLDLLARFDRRAVVAVQITGGDHSALAPESVMVGSDGRPGLGGRPRPVLHPLWRCSRTRLIEGIDRAASAGRVRLPTDEANTERVAELRAELVGMMAEVTAAGRQRIVPGRSDDLAMALALGLHAIDRGLLPRERRRSTSPAISALAWT